MSKPKKDWVVITLALLVTVSVFFFSRELNKKSFGEISYLVYRVNREIGNLRSGASIRHKIIKKMREGSFFTITKQEGDWFLGKSGFTQGWVHRSVLGQYLYIGYYEHYVEGKSILETVWD